MDNESDQPAEPNAAVHPWTVLSSRVRAKCAVFDVMERHCRHPERGTEGDFYVLESRDWVNVIPVTPDHQIVMVRQWRFGVERMSWEIPGGIMEIGEDPIRAGLRELQEETGYACARSRLLGQIRPNPAILNNTCYFVLADGARLTGEIDWDRHEELEVKLFPIDEVFAMAARGEIIHALVVNALFHFYPEWERIKARRRE